MERFLPRLAGEVATPDLIRGSRRGPIMLAPPPCFAWSPPPRTRGGATVRFLTAVPFCAPAKWEKEFSIGGLAPNPDRSHFRNYVPESQLQ
jgi:hypothetical protein